MGFNDWNVFGCNVSAARIEAAALAMHDNGMQQAGYEYVNVDDCWINGRNVTTGPADKIAAGRDAGGHLVADPTYSPPSAAGKNDGMKVLADYVPPRSRRRRPVMRPPTR
jgi:alpha-galactosidase